MLFTHFPVVCHQLMNWDQQYKHNNTGCGEQDSVNGGCSNICVPHQLNDSTATQNRVCLCPDQSKPPSATGENEPKCYCTDHNEAFNITTGRCTFKGLCQLLIATVVHIMCGIGAWTVILSYSLHRFSCFHHQRRLGLLGSVNFIFPMFRLYKCVSRFIADSHSRNCTAGYFRCSNNLRCIRSNWVCDKDNDCGDYSDETNWDRKSVV